MLLRLTKALEVFLTMMEYLLILLTSSLLPEKRKTKQLADTVFIVNDPTNISVKNVLLKKL